MFFNKHSRPSKVLLFLYIACFFWISDIGYFILKLLTFGKLRIPKYSSLLIRDESFSEVGFFRKLAIGIRYVLLDFFDFFVGIFFLFLIIRMFIFIYIFCCGPIPSA
jgi:hypothetical protein